MDEPELIVLPVSSPDDPDGRRLRATLEAHLESRRLHALHLVLLYGVALFSAPLWCAAAWPPLVPAGLRNLCVLSWAMCAAGSSLSLASEWRWRRRLAAEGDVREGRERTVSS